MYLAETEADSESGGPGWSLRFCIPRKLPASANAVGLWAAIGKQGPKQLLLILKISVLISLP